MVRSKMFERSAWWSESFWPEPGVVMMSTSSPWSPKNPSSRATSRGRSWIAFIIEALTFFMSGPRAVVDGVLVGGAGHGHVPLHRPAVRVVPALARVRRRRAVEEAPVLDFFRLEDAAGLAREVMEVGTRILLQLLASARLGAEELLERGGVH